MVHEWMDFAECKETLTFTDLPESVQKSYCLKCPVRKQCGEYGLRVKDRTPHIIYGGYSGRTRKKLLAK